MMCSYWRGYALISAETQIYPERKSSMEGKINSEKKKKKKLQSKIFKTWVTVYFKLDKIVYYSIKGIVSDSNNIFLYHESEDINKKSLFPTFQLIPILRFHVMHDYVCFIAPIDYCVELSLVYETFL